MCLINTSPPSIVSSMLSLNNSHYSHACAPSPASDLSPRPLSSPPWSIATLSPPPAPPCPAPPPSPPPRHAATSLGLTPKEPPSGKRRQLGAISKRGDRYL